MILRDRYDGGESPFEGNREVLLRHLPADARIVRARAIVTPIDGTGGRDPFVETILFRGNAGDWGATKSAASGWVEVDFHARRTLASVQGTNISGAALQVDLGGVFVRPNQDGTIGPPGAPSPLPSNAASLPSLAATRFRLTTTTALAMDVSAVRVRSAPSGVTLALRGQPALWFHAGELTRPETTPDFGLALQAYLDDVAEVADGVFLLPFVLHSDSIARLAVELEIEYLRRVSVLPEGVRDAVLPYDHGSLPRTGGLQVALPGDARVARGSGRAAGAFQGSRIAFGPTGEVTPLADLSVDPGSSPAHPILLPEPVEAVAVDLLLTSITRTAKLQLDLRQDLDGKPAGESFLPAPVPFDLDREMAGRPTWVSVPLAAPFQFRSGQERTYWMVLQSLDGEAAWSVEEAAPALPGMQLTQDGGFSWRQAAVAQSGHLAGFFRLRFQPATFRMPIELQVGSGDAARRVNLSRFEPQGRVDLSFSDLPEVAEAFNQALAVADRCPEVEHLGNGRFERWIRTGSELGRRSEIPLQPDEGIPFEAARLAVTPDGRTALVATSDDTNEMALRIVDLDREVVVETVRLTAGGARVAGVAVDPGGTRAWVALSAFPGAWIWIVDLASRRSVGDPLPVALPATSGPGETVTALASSPDGATLYVTLSLQSLQNVASGGRVIALDVQLLEEAALQGAMDASSAILGEEALSVLFPAALAVSPDGARLHVLVSTLGATPRTQIVPIEAAALRRRDDLALDLGTSAPRSLAGAPDGRLVAALDDQVVLETGQAIPVPPEQAALAVDVDGARVFVVGEEGLTIVDLRHRTAAAPLNLGSPVSDVAVTPGGDRVLAVIPSTATLVSIPVGTAIPAVWTVTAGTVRRFSAPGREPAALLGDLPQRDGDAAGPSLPAATAAISQVVPVAAICTYELTFEAIASERDAVAEVIWKTGACGMARTDTVAITPIADARADGVPRLAFHRARLQAPAGAVQAEVRFRAPAGVLALVDNASFQATAASILNSELRGTGLPEPWQLDPEGAAGFVVTARESGLRLRNAGTREVAVFQEIELGQSPDFLLDVQGRSVPVSAGQAGRVEIHWLGEETAEAGTASSWDLPVEGFDALSAQGTAPAGAVRAELRLVVPEGASVEIRRMDLRFPEPAQVPVTFVAQAPGELAVVGWELLYDQVPRTRPPVPPEGLCTPEPPPLAAGEKSAEECCEHDDEPAAAVVAAMAPALAAFQGRPVPVAVPVTAIRGIGRGRSRRLRGAGMGSVEAVAATSPGTLRQVLRGISEKAAIEVILAARETLRTGRA